MRVISVTGRNICRYKDIIKKDIEDIRANQKAPIHASRTQRIIPNQNAPYKIV
jgi:hypothetical protein